MSAPKKVNSFMVFVNNWRQNTPGGEKMSVAEAVERCGDMWKNLSEEQREPFIDYAKETKSSGSSANKEQSLANEVQREKAETQLMLKRSIEGMVLNAMKANDLENSKFVFCNFNYFTKSPNSDVYVPAEFTACQYSLQDGIISMFSSLINPGALDIGLNRDARDHSESTHKLPLPPKALGESNLRQLYKDVVEYFAKCQTTRPLVVFTSPDMIPIVKSCFRYLACEGKEDFRRGDLHRIAVLDMLYLFYVMKRELIRIAVMPNVKLSQHVTDKFFLRDFFEFTSNIACDHHEKDDRATYCTQSMVMRWCYTFSDYLCGDLDIKLVPGIHIPNYAKPNNDDKALSAATSSLSLQAESSAASFHSLPANKPRPLPADTSTASQYLSSAPSKDRSSAPDSSSTFKDRSSASDCTDYADAENSRRGGRRNRGNDTRSGGDKDRSDFSSHSFEGFVDNDQDFEE